MTAVLYSVDALSFCALGAVFSGSSSAVPNALLILTRPLVATLLLSEDFTSTLSKIIALRSATVDSGYCAASNAIEPATCGVAIEVPLRYAYLFSG